MKCNNCPLFSSWNNESDRGESCGLFGDSWDSPFQYEDKIGNIVGCYIDRHLIEKTDQRYMEHLEQEAESWAEWFEKEQEGGE